MEFSRNFRKAYFPILHNNITTQATEEDFNHDPGRSGQYLLQKSTEILKGAASLVKQLQRSNRKLETQQLSFAANTDWQGDIHQMKDILDIGRKIGEQKVESILTGGEKPLLDVKATDISQLLFDKHNRLAGDLTWGGAVKKQEKAIMRLVNTLPLA